MYALFILPCFYFFFISYGLYCKRKGIRVYRVGPVLAVFSIAAIVSAFLFSLVNQTFDMKWVKSPEDFLKSQCFYLLPPLAGFILATIRRGDWKKEKS